MIQCRLAGPQFRPAFSQKRRGPRRARPLFSRTGGPLWAPFRISRSALVCYTPSALSNMKSECVSAFGAAVTSLPCLTLSGFSSPFAGHRNPAERQDTSALGAAEEIREKQE